MEETVRYGQPNLIPNGTDLVGRVRDWVDLLLDLLAY